MLTTGSPCLDTEGRLDDEEYHYTTEGPVTTGRRPSYLAPTGSRALATRSDSLSPVRRYVHPSCGTQGQTQVTTTTQPAHRCLCAP